MALATEFESTEAFVQSLEADIKKPGRWLADHPLIKKLERHELTQAQIAGLMGQVYRQTCEVVRWLGAIYAKCDDMKIRREIFNNLVEEELGGFSNTDAHFHLAARVAVAAGAEREALDRVPLLPQTKALIDYGDEICYRDPAWIKPFGAFFGFEYQSPKAYGPIAKALAKSYGMKDEEVLFFSVHVTADEDHGDAIVRVFDRYARDAKTRAILRECSNKYAELYYGMLSTYEAFH
ncbi:MAG: hypothetical protein FJX61_05600 [Alphaproteobacteria bacterium]|nr:hypothetical protein [Alphaproteobacteria bacterium]